MQILIAEDEVVSRRVLEKTLLRWGYDVLVATDGQQALEIMERTDAPHLAVLDWMMPGLSGLDICTRLRRQESEVHPYLILLTAMNRKKDLVQGFEAGADDYVFKPFDADELKVRIAAGERIVRLQLDSLAALTALRKQATHDELTGLRNRAAIMLELDREFARVPRTASPVAVVIADVDLFKHVNDQHGHQVGDKVLAEVARRMASEMRSYEAIGRYGGEEFMLVLCGCNADGGQAVAERLRAAVGDREMAVGQTRLTVTVSFGVASTNQLKLPTRELLVEMADAALYRAKHNGRNRVEVAPAPWGSSGETQAPAPVAMAGEHASRWFPEAVRRV